MTHWKDLHFYWFGDIQLSSTYLDERSKLWFHKNSETDREIRSRFAPMLDNFNLEEFKAWKSSPQAWVSLIVLLDQVPRNSFRGSGRSFQYDSKALSLCKEGLGRVDTELSMFEKLFFYLPLEHSEDLEDQALSLEKFRKSYEAQTDDAMKAYAKENLSYAQAHYDIIEKFGRFPHRNEALGRVSTPEEIEFLKQPGSSF